MAATTRFTKILIANRGEIACRVIRTAHEQGYATVAVYSDADVNALHVIQADEAMRLGPAPVAESYLDGGRIIAAAKSSGADAVHPGYGFLSENAGFAAACTDAGLVFIGPPVEAIRLMGDKARSKARMLDACVPCVPGYQGDDQDDSRFAEEAEKIGYPVMIKAAAGGGGRGMRLVVGKADLAAGLQSARSEAQNAFGDATLLLEKALIGARHVEIQVFGDQQGNIIHLGERDCSVQRRHQKVIEEAPSPAVDAPLRDAMGTAAVAAGRAIGYVGAGTVEFLLDATGRFYFLEMNTRLQVEHPVTEFITGVDLVAWQLDVAQGNPLPLTQEGSTTWGHAIEARLYAEDAGNGFLPQTGTVLAWQPPIGFKVRVDHGLREGTEVSPFYDPLLAKVIAYGQDREEARRRLVRALAETVLLGVTTNKAFLIEALGKPDFVAGNATTGFIEANFSDAPAAAPAPNAIALAVVLFVAGTGDGFRSSRWGESVVRLAIGGDAVDARCRRDDPAWVVTVGDAAIKVNLLERTADMLRYDIDGHTRRVRFARHGDKLFLDEGSRTWRFEDVTYAPPDSVGALGDGVLRAPMNGRVLSVEVVTGDRVRRGQVIAVIEAMKMEHAVVASLDGTVESVGARLGAQVANRDVLATIVEEAG